MKYLKIECEENNKENSVKRMLKNLYETSIEELNGNFTPEMNETINRIRNSFSNLPSEDELIKNANEKFMKKQLIPLNEIGKKKREKVKLENENEFLKHQLEKMNCRRNNKLKNNTQLHMTKFFNNLKIVEQIVKDEEKDYNQKNNEKISIENIR